MDFGNEEERERHMAGVLLEDGTGRAEGAARPEDERSFPRGCRLISSPLGRPQCASRNQ